MSESTTQQEAKQAGGLDRQPTLRELTEPYEPVEGGIIPIDYNPRRQGEGWLAYQWRRIRGPVGTGS